MLTGSLGPAEIVAVAAIVLALAAIALWWRAETRGSRRSRHRQVRARHGEDRAEWLLATYGFRVVARQPCATWAIEIDGEEFEVRSRADLLVEAHQTPFAPRGTRFVAEVKTGTRAPDPTLPSTRRQLFEYLHVFDVEGVLLVDMESETLHSVTFPVPPGA